MSDDLFVPVDGEVVTIRPKTSTLSIQKLPYFLGIAETTVGSTGLAMHIVVIPPGGKAETHFHHNFETAIYVLEGSVETRYGLQLEKSSINVAGDFLFIPPFVPHQPINLSDSEPARAIVARNDANEHEQVTLYSAETTP